MATPEELRAANALTNSIIRHGELLVWELIRRFKDTTSTDVDVEDMATIIREAILAASSLQAKKMKAFIEASLGLQPGSFIHLADGDFGMLGARSKEIAGRVKATGSVAPLASSRSVFSNFAMGTVDATQMAIAPGARWVRQVDSKACDWCRDQVAVFARTQVWARHDNCRCVKVRGF